MLDLFWRKEVASDSACVAATADAQVIAADPLGMFTDEETDEEDDSSSSSEQARTPYAAGSAAYSENLRRLGTIVGLSTLPAPPQSLTAAASRRAEPDVMISRRRLRPRI